jgi:hypothetical protein
MKNLLYKQSLRKKTSSTGGERKEIAQRNVRAHGRWYGGGCGGGSGRCWCGFMVEAQQETKGHAVVWPLLNSSHGRLR